MGGCHTWPMQVPIACTLTATAAGDRIEEWRRFLADCTSVVERTSARQLRVRLVDSGDALHHAVDLARREKTCCAFFEFSIDVEADASWLSVEVPADAEGVLAEFASLLPR
jgi:hypothetical protein